MRVSSNAKQICAFDFFRLRDDDAQLSSEICAYAIFYQRLVRNHICIDGDLTKICRKICVPHEKSLIFKKLKS
jgi:hypothetical protein